jgi:putative N6-adenine-specific DNA methylase
MKFVAKTLYGLENMLAAELTELGASDVKAANRAVLFEGDKYLLYRANYSLRTALSILMPVSEFRVRSKDDLYTHALRINWSRYMDAEDTFSVVPVVMSPHFEHSGYAGLVVKDAVADYFRDKTGKRPSVNSDDPSILINLHISNDLATVSLDSSVAPLFKRGYRKEQSAAPLNEVLAAGILMISGWNCRTDIVDPMCGSGTFSIEAGLMACKIAPGKFRSSYGFMKWRDFDNSLFEKMKQDCEKERVAPSVKIEASDISQQAVEQSSVNINSAGLKEIISLRRADFRETGREQSGQKFIFINPPYGLRLQPEELDSIYSMIGTTLKHHYPGCTAWIITPNLEAIRHIGLRPKEKHTLYNGALECVLLRYEMYEGTKKTAAKDSRP